MKFVLLEILQPPEEGGEKVVDWKGEPEDVDESETEKAEHQNLVFPMHLFSCNNNTTNPSVSNSHQNFHQLLLKSS